MHNIHVVNKLGMKAIKSCNKHELSYINFPKMLQNYRESMNGIQSTTHMQDATHVRIVPTFTKLWPCIYGVYTNICMFVLTAWKY